MRTIVETCVLISDGYQATENVLSHVCWTTSVVEKHLSIKFCIFIFTITPTKKKLWGQL
jgi:hypothetical protein